MARENTHLSKIQLATAVAFLMFLSAGSLRAQTVGTEEPALPLIDAPDADLSMPLDPLRISSADVYVEPDENGYHIWIRNKPGIRSVLLTESSADPDLDRPVYSLRSPSYNPVNSEEQRMIDGEFLPRDLNSLIDSTPETNSFFPEGAYRIYLPRTVIYGYPWSRSGTLVMERGSWLNIRTFALRYGNYEGARRDNPFRLNYAEASAPPEPVAPAEVDAQFTAMIQSMSESIDDLSLCDIDITLVLDTTVSMQDKVDFLQAELVPMLRQKTALFRNFRVAVVLYRDYNEEYLTRVYPFMENLGQIQSILNDLVADGGGTPEEAVYEGLYIGLTVPEWQAATRLIIQVGDAPPHAAPVGMVTREIVEALAAENRVRMLPVFIQNPPE